jgi:2'-5' RNA ligase
VFSHVDWVTPQPAHFLHIGIAGVSIGPRSPAPNEINIAVERAQRAWASTNSFDVTYTRVNCFDAAVIVEVEGDGPRGLAADLLATNYWNKLPIEGAMTGVLIDTFLPHLTIGTVNSPNDPTTLRDALLPVREAELGHQRVTEATLCVIPASRTTILDPWEVVGSVGFREHS